MARQLSSCRRAALLLTRGIVLLAALYLARPAAAANIFVTNAWGFHSIHIDGAIEEGDEKRFAAIDFHDPEHTLVHASGPGGPITAAFDIADTITRRGWSTFLTVDDGQCASACAFIWLSGKHAIIQRNSDLCFHRVYDGRTGQPIGPEGDAFVAKKLIEYGLNREQAWALATAARPSDCRNAMEWWARQLGFRWRQFWTPIAVRSCLAQPLKFCLAAP